MYPEGLREGVSDSVQSSGLLLATGLQVENLQMHTEQQSSRSVQGLQAESRQKGQKIWLSLSENIDFWHTGKVNSWLLGP